MAYQVLKTCTLCGACLPECPTGSIVAGTAQVHIDADTCANHAACVAVCPVDAIVPIEGTTEGTDTQSKFSDDEEE